MQVSAPNLLIAAQQTRETRRATAPDTANAAPADKTEELSPIAFKTAGASPNASAMAPTTQHDASAPLGSQIDIRV